ncbi:hypothetical protein Q7P37_006655 [Cladosporium fusiforme]
MADAQPPLSWQQSADANNPTISDHLPDEVVTCLENARFLHLATCTDNIPHVSLMNYTYLPSHPFTSSTLQPGPVIVMTTNPSSKKTINLIRNPNVSLLVHDWVSSRPPHMNSDRERSPVGSRTGRSSLANMLMSMNSAAVSSISATINGSASVLQTGSEEERWCKKQHLENNTFEGQAEGSEQLFGTSPTNARTGDGGRGSYIEDEEVRVVVVRIKDGRISDWKGGVKDWVIAEPGQAAAAANGPTGLVNGI